MLDFLKNGSFRKIILLALFYAALSFAYSLIGLAHPVVAGQANEYTPSKLLVEVAGHFVFGFVASLPLLDIQLCVLTGALAVLIDSDHLLEALNLSVSGRPDHSILYALVSLVALVYVGNKMGLDESTLTKLSFIAPITLLSHVSYDIFARTGPSFPLWVPFDFGEIFLPYYFWYVLEASAILMAVGAYFVARRQSVNRKGRDSPLKQSAPDAYGKPVPERV
ncbi:MAG: hypothetical protein ACRECH_13550 [Nitrososphaerales archaeon]